MPNPGDEYEEIVAAVAKALSPGAIVKIGQWIVGPDGRRDMDVEVRGTIEEKPIFILVECKDWTRPVGIKEIDALESKGRDLGVDETIIYSNSGFSADALRKARRVGIGACSALKAGDKRINLAFYTQLVAKRLSVDRFSAVAYFPKDDLQDIEEEWDVRSLTYGGRPVVNWISRISMDILERHENCENVVANFAFREQAAFELRDKLVRLTGLGFRLECSKKWVAQEVQVDITLGMYDHIRKRHVIPSNQGYIIGSIDPDGWREIDCSGWKPPEEGSFELYLTLLNPVARVGPEEVPDLDSIISEREEKCSNPLANHERKWPC